MSPHSTSIGRMRAPGSPAPRCRRSRRSITPGQCRGRAAPDARAPRRTPPGPARRRGRRRRTGGRRSTRSTTSRPDAGQVDQHDQRGVARCDRRRRRSSSSARARPAGSTPCPASWSGLSIDQRRRRAAARRPRPAAAPTTTTAGAQPARASSARRTQGPDPVSTNAFGRPYRRPEPAASSSPATPGRADPRSRSIGQRLMTVVRVDVRHRRQRELDLTVGRQRALHVGAQLGDRVLPVGQLGPGGVDTLAAFVGHGSSSRSRTAADDRCPWCPGPGRERRDDGGQTVRPSPFWRIVRIRSTRPAGWLSPTHGRRPRIAAGRSLRWMRCPRPWTGCARGTTARSWRCCAPGRT